MRRSKVIAAAALFAGATLLASACGGSGGSGTTDQNGSSADVKSMAVGKAESGDNFKLADAKGWDGTVTIGIDDGYSAYNNQTPDTNTSYNNYISIAVLSGADELDGNNKVLLNNDVLDSWNLLSTNPQVVEYKIKPNVKWSDGAPWNCKDFYLAWLSQNGKSKAFNAVSHTGYEDISQATCKDDLTFDTTYSKPYLDYKGLFNSPAMMPAHILEQQTGIPDITKVTPTSDAATLKKVGDFWTNRWKGFDKAIMPGSGPYVITAFDQNQKAVTLQKNPYWIGSKGGPSTIIVKAMADTKAMATALQNGEIDIAASTQPDATAADTMKGLASQGVTYGSAPQQTFEHLDLQFKNPIFANDLPARKAFIQAVQRKAVTDKLLKEVQADAAPLGSVLFQPGEQGYTDVYSDKSNGDAAAAAKTLTDDGWVKGPDGVFTKNGHRYSVTVTHNENTRRSQTVEIIISQLKAAGIEVRDETDAAFLSGGRLSTGKYDVALFGWSATPFKAETQSIYLTGGTQNYQNLVDPKIDQAFQAAAAATDQAARTKAFQDADAAIANDYATLPLFQTPSMWAFKGIDRVFMQSYNGVLWNVGEWEQKQ